MAHANIPMQCNDIFEAAGDAHCSREGAASGRHCHANYESDLSPPLSGLFAICLSIPVLLPL